MAQPSTQATTTLQKRAEDLSARKFLQLSFPVMLSLLSQNLIGVVDTAFISRLGEAELGGTAIGGLVYYSLYTIGFGLASGTQILISHRYGANRRNEIGPIVAQSIHLLLLAALFIIAIGYPAGNWIFSNLVSSPAVSASATEYWNYRLLGYLFAFTASVFRSFFVGISNTKVLTYNSLVMFAVNVVLDYGLIFGNLGLPALGVKGAAIASVLAELASLLFYLFYIKLRVKSHHYHLSASHLRSWNSFLASSLIHLSQYLMLQALICQSGWTILFFMMETLGERQLAVASIVRSLDSLLLIPTSAYITAVRTTVSQIMGARQEDAIPRYLHRTTLVSFTTVFAITLLVFLFPQLPLRIFTSNAELIEAAIPALRVICVALVFNSLAASYFAAVGATGATKMVFLIELINMVIYIAYGSLMVYGIRASVAGCFTTEILYYISVGLMCYLFMRSGKWRLPKWQRIR